MSGLPAGIGCWMINLPRSVERRQAMAAQLAPLGIDYALFEAVDGRAEWDRLLPKVDTAAFKSHVGRGVLPGEVGCYHSHLRVWQAFLDSPYEVALVLEDDVIFHDDFLPALEVAMAHVAEWDLLKLNRIRAKAPRRQFHDQGYDFNAYLGVATGTGAYLITRAAAEKLLPKMLPIRMPVDHVLARYYALDLRLMGLEPFPSHVEDGGQSTITGKQFAGVKKLPPWRRLPSYIARISADWGRYHWLRKRGMLKSKPR